MKTVIYLSLAFTIGYLSVQYLGVAGMGMALFFLITGFALACIPGAAWLVIQARLEEIDLKRCLPEYQDYIKGVPRFLFLRQGVQGKIR